MTLLTADKVLTVKAHYAKRDGKPMPGNLYRWDFKTISDILERPEYTGYTVNFKICSKSHKLKKQLNNAPKNYRIFPNTQPTIVNEFVKKIIVHAPDKSSDHRMQKIQIVWNFIGELEQDNETQTAPRQRKSKTA